MIDRDVITWLEEARRKGASVRFRGDVDLDLSRDEFWQAMLVEPDGVRLLCLLDEVCGEAEKLSLIRAGDGRCKIPSWDALVTFLRGLT